MKSVYIHIPFCKSICSYCDFCKVFYYPKWSHEYLVKLKEEIEDQYNGEKVKSIYIGGGTPSVLSLSEIKFLMSLISVFHLIDDYEFTFECNLEDIKPELLEVLKNGGVNRLSIGIQSFQKENLKILGREHDFADALEKMKFIRNYGFSNVNLDLIYAIPGETLKDLKEDLKLFLKLKPDHISTYSLMIEPHTILSYEHFASINEEQDLGMYELVCKTLKKAGFTHYEVSNFAKKKKKSIHNLTYWNNEEYYGFGLSASGYLEQIRYTNTRNLSQYLRGDYHGVEEILSKQDIMDNEVMLGLRKLEGVNKKRFEEKYHIKMEDAYPIKPLLKNGDLKQKGNYIFIAPDKLYVMNEILLKMI